ncbi:MAG TPA: SGNH/GDSL hydrolase family protein [Tepidisphaeraceae bacterium]|nr:SGNH/GDSL hydrolase family protein [Tepidisphaeraceae bacterium]
MIPQLHAAINADDIRTPPAGAPLRGLRRPAACVVATRPAQFARAATMKTILCYGDSNTHGTNPADWSRFDLHTRWPGVLRRELGADYWVIEEGCGGRTTVWDDPVEDQLQGSKNGAAYLRPCLHSHQPLDLVVILLGTNDLKARFGAGAEDIARGAGALVDLVRQSTAGPGGRAPRVLLLAPPPVAPLAGTPFSDMLAGAEEKSARFGQFFRQVAAERDCPLLDLAEVIVSSPTEGVHFDAPEHAKLARAVAAKVRELLT